VVGTVLIPYREIPLAERSGRLPITKVVMGPALEVGRNARSIATLLKQAGVKPNVLPSKVQFRIVR
jgi:hypothetical protein